MGRFLRERWFLLVLAAALFIGIRFPRPFRAFADSKSLQNGMTAAVLFLMSLPLPLRAMWDTLRRPTAAGLGVAMNYVAVPLLAWGVAAALHRLGLGLDMSQGILIASSTPCSMVSASVWTRKAGGNEAVAILVTVITNSVCFVVTPLWLRATLGRSPTDEVFSVGAMIWRLGWTVLLPMAIAQSLRLWRPLAEVATARKGMIGIVSQCGILTMVFIGAVQTGLRLERTNFSEIFVGLSVSVAAVLGIHLAALASGLRIANGLGLTRADSIAVAIAGSQKTLMVGVSAGLALEITILPMVAYHVGQLLLDTVIADRWRRRL